MAQRGSSGLAGCLAQVFSALRRKGALRIPRGVDSLPPHLSFGQRGRLSGNPGWERAPSPFAWPAFRPFSFSVFWCDLRLACCSPLFSGFFRFDFRVCRGDLCEERPATGGCLDFQVAGGRVWDWSICFGVIAMDQRFSRGEFSGFSGRFSTIIAMGYSTGHGEAVGISDILISRASGATRCQGSSISELAGFILAWPGATCRGTGPEQACRWEEGRGGSCGPCPAGVDRAGFLVYELPPTSRPCRTGAPFGATGCARGAGVRY